MREDDQVRLVEKLPLIISPEFRLSLTEEDLAVLAIVTVAYLESNPEAENSIATASLELAEILKKVGGDDFRWFQKMSKKLKKLSAKAVSQK